MFSNDPYAALLHEDAVADPLRAYFSPIPQDMVGRGRGVFELAGPRIRGTGALWRLLAHARIAFPERCVDVPFEVENTSDPDGTRRARRIAHLPGRDRIMVDAMRATGGGIVDVLGADARIEVHLDVDGADGGVRMRSRRVRLRIGRIHLPLSHLVEVRVDDGWDPRDRRQTVDVRVRMPVLGDVFGYRGSFEYELRPR